MKIIGIGGMAQSGKDTFAAIAKDILEKNGYNPHRIAFADELKFEVNKMMREYGFQDDIYTEDTLLKTKNRPLLVWWGTSKRLESNGEYWIKKVDAALRRVKEKISQAEDEKTIYLITDVRHENEVEWVKVGWEGYFIHIRKYEFSFNGSRSFDLPPNEMEGSNDPIIRKLADYNLEWENRKLREGESIVQNLYLRGQVLYALNRHPFFGWNLTD